MNKNLTDSQKIDTIYVLLTDENVGVCTRVKKLEHTVNGNGKPGLAEDMRIIKRWWMVLIGGGSMLVSVLSDNFAEIIRFLSKG